MRIVCVGGGPAGLFFSILMRLRDDAHEVTVLERNPPGATYGFGVVFSDATLEEIAAGDPPSYAEITRHFHHWDDIDIHYRGELLRSTGHGFSGLARSTLLEILSARARELGVDLQHGVDVTDPSPWEDADLLVAADGVNSTVRELHPERYEPRIDLRPNRFVWLGTTRPFPAFTFYFREDEHGLWRVHAYQYEPAEGGEARSTFIVEAREETWAATGLPEDDEEAAAAFCADLFEEELEGHPLVLNRSIWRRFPTLRTGRWWHGNTVLIGDAAHTAHFSVGSGTRMAMLDAIALRDALAAHDGEPCRALPAYEEARRPEVESLQRAARASLEWFEGTERYMDDEPEQFAFSLLTRSLRITHQDLRIRDPVFTAGVDRRFAERAAGQAEVAVPTDPPPPPMFTPFRLRGLLLQNRVVVSAMCQYSAADGTPDDWHLVHLGSRAVGGAGLVMSEMTNVSARGRISPGCTGMYLPEHVPAWKRIVDFVHDQSRAKIGLQLGHAGRKGSTRLSWEGDVEPLEEGGWDVLAPSALPWKPENPVPRPMDRQDMDRVREEYVRAAENGHGGGLRPPRDPLRPRLPAGQLHLPTHQHARGRVRRAAGEPDALPAGGAARRAGRVARGPAHFRADLGGRLGAGRHDGRRRGGGGPQGRRGGRRYRGRVGRTDGPVAAAALRATVPDTLRRPDPARGGDPDHGGREHLLVHGREHDPRGGPSGPVLPGAGPPVGAVLDAPRRVRPRVRPAVAEAILDAGRLYPPLRMGLLDVDRTEPADSTRASSGSDETPPAPADESRYLTYAGYLHLDELLSLQRRRAGEHDEMLFIIIHQVYELWFKELLHELDYVEQLLGRDDLPTALHTMKRILTVLKVMVAQIDILETMTPREFLTFRNRLEAASGLESFQFRELEFALGIKRPGILERYPEGSEPRSRLQQRLERPTLWDAFLEHVNRSGFPVPRSALEREVSRPVEASPQVQDVLVRVYAESPALAQLCERLVDLDEGLQEWRYRHVKMVERTIGAKRGTGGTEGAGYLRTTLSRPVFPDLWEIRTRL